MVSLSRRRFGLISLGCAFYPLLNGCFPEQRENRKTTTPENAFSDSWSDGLPRSAPETLGVSSGAILDFLSDVEEAGLELHSFMVMRNGHVIAEAFWSPYRPDRVHMTHSLTKSVTATSVGLAVDEGRFGLDEKVVSFFPGYVPADASENVRAMTVRDLLTMETGHDQETSGSVWRPIPTSWIAEFFKIPAPHRPGTFFKYTSAASFMLSAIVTRTTGQTLEKYIRPRLLEPLGITDLHWDLSPGGINSGGNGLSWTTSASLKLGALHAQRGVWKGQTILSPEWVKDATTPHSGNEEGEYGYQWWIGPGKAFYALGLFVQMAVVFPEHDATIALFAAIDGSEKLKPYLWKHFPAAFGSVPLAMTENAEFLKNKTGQLSLLVPLDGSVNENIEQQVSGRKFNISDNDQSVEWVSFTFTTDRCTYRMRDDRGEHEIVAGRTEYIEQLTNMTGARLHHQYQTNGMRVAAGAQWVDAHTLRMTWQYVEAAFRDTVVCRFQDGKVTIDRSVNLNTAETSLPTLTGVLTR